MFSKFQRSKAFLLILLTFLFSSPAFSEKECFLISKKGEVKKVKSTYKGAGVVRCFKKKELLSSPSKVVIKGNIRKEHFSTSLGKVFLRWDRASEKYFRRTPYRAVVDSAKAVSIALRSKGFSSFFRNKTINWDIVFFSEKSRPQGIPLSLLESCHPGWMTPPANIYIASAIIAKGCNTGGSNVPKKVAEERLTRVIIHEMGHVVEYYLLEGKNFNRAQSEGFATWFESYVAGFTPALSKEKIIRELVSLAGIPSKGGFSGTIVDYAKASIPFLVIEKEKGIYGIKKVYKRMRESSISLEEAVKEAFYWSKKDFNKKINKFILARKHKAFF